MVLVTAWWLVDTLKLVSAWVVVGKDRPGLDIAVDVVVVVVVVVVGWLKLDSRELASALLRAWNSAARFLSFDFLSRLFCLRLAGGEW